MKTIKKCFKQILCVAVFALLAVLFAFNPTAMFSKTGVSAVEVAQFKQAILNAVKLPIEDVDLDGDNKELKIPLLTKKDGSVAVPSTYFIRVTEPDGSFHDCEIKSAMAEDSYFEYHAAKAGDPDPLTANGYITVKNLYNGYYYVSYYFKTTEAETTNRYYFSTPVEVYVKNVSFELTFVTPEGNKQLVKSTVQKGDVIDLPVAYVKYADRDEYYKDGEDFIKVEPAVEMITKNGVTLPVESTEFKSENGKYTLTPAEKGTYSIRYTYNGENVYFDFDVLDSYNGEATLSIPVKDLTMPNVQLGQKGIKLPSLTVNNDVSKNIDHNVEKIEIVKDSDKSIMQTLEPNTYTFDMTIESFKRVSGSTQSAITNYYDLIGDYSVTYYVKDAYGNTQTITLALSNVKDNTAPSVYMAYNYDLTGGKWTTDDTNDGVPYLKRDAADVAVTVATKQEDDETVDAVDTNYAVDLKSNYGYNELSFPAIYAKDLVTNYEDFVFVRYLQSKSNYSTKLYLDNLRYSNGKLIKVGAEEGGYNHATGENTGIGEFNKVVKFEFAPDEQSSYTDKEYTLRYQVIAKSLVEGEDGQQTFVLQDDGEYYSFKLLERPIVGASGSETSTPTIKINVNGNNKTIGQNDKLSFTVTSTDDNDKRLKNVVFYYNNSAQETDEAILGKIQKAINTIAFGAAEKDADDGYVSSYFADYTANILDRQSFVTEMKKAEAFGDSFALFDAESNDQFSVKLNLSTINPIRVVAVTMNDNNIINIATKTYKIKSTSEGVAPVVSTITDAEVEGANVVETDYQNASELVEKEFGQSEVVYLPTVVFTDADTSLTLTARYYILTENFNPETDKINYLPVDNMTFSRTTIENATITTSAVGRYYVVYTAEDDGGNQSFLYFTFTVKDTSTPILYVDVYADEGNESFNYSYPYVNADINSVITFVPTVWSSDLTTDLTQEDMTNVPIVISGNPTPDIVGDSDTEYSYRFTEPGDYVVTVSGWRVGEKETNPATPKTIYIHIDVPTLAWNDLTKVKDSVIPYADPGDKYYLPNLTATQGNIPVEYTVTVTGRSNGDQEVLKDESGKRYFMVPNFENADSNIDVYTIKFSASTKYSSLPEEVVGTIKVGDRVKPTFSYASDVESKLQQNVVYDGTNAISYAIDLDKSENKLVITISSNGKELNKIETGLGIDDKNNNPDKVYTTVTDWDRLSVSLVAVDGQTLASPTTSGNVSTYTISAVGKYKLVLTFLDGSDNEGRNEFTFSVVSKTEPRKVNDNVVGIVLIVVSLVILAGVILFFVFTGKKGGNNKTKSNKASKKQTQELEAETTQETDSDAKSGDVE